MEMGFPLSCNLQKNKLTKSVQNDVTIVGGGLAGLSLSILLARAGKGVKLLEKEKYPFHRVCGEYISMESWDYLVKLGIPLEKLGLPIIRKIELSAQKVKPLLLDLPLGGFGISRYMLDASLADIARENGVIISEQTKVTSVDFQDEQFIIECADGSRHSSRAVCNAFGKRSNLDIKWQRPFILKTRGRLNNYVGVKYHVHADYYDDTIALHLFKTGYCGLVRIEGGRFNLCYITSAVAIREAGSIEAFEKKYLSVFLEKVKKIDPAPVTISQISFEKKSQVEDHALMIGDAAGMIAPLCGNGMSMALHAGKIAFENLVPFIERSSSRDEMEKKFTRDWKKNFSRRLSTGRLLQRISQNEKQMNFLLALGKQFPRVMKYLISKTHGKEI
jgi:menaquinone-9 beta-reductase